MDFQLPPPSLPLQQQQPQPQNKKPQKMQRKSSLSNTLIPLTKWLRHHQKKLFKLNKRRINNCIQPVPHSNRTLDLTILGFGEELKKEVYDLLLELLPYWLNNYDLDQLEMTALRGAMTNSMFILRLPNQDKILLRIYGNGSEQFFNRKRELSILKILSSLQIGPEFLGMFGNGRFEQFMEAETLTANSIKIPEISTQIAQKMYEIHSLVGVMPTSENHLLENSPVMSRKVSIMIEQKEIQILNIESEFWDRLSDWYEKALESFPLLLKKFPQYRSRLEQINLPAFKIEIEKLQQLIEQLGSPVAFTHNDTQYGNIMKTKDGEILMIDYEYACYNYRSFDIANHFCEWAADYHSTEPHLLDFTKMPTKEEQIRFLESYLEARDKFFKRKPSFSSSHKLNTTMNDSSPPLLPLALIGPSPSLSPSLSPFLSPEQLISLRKQEIEFILKEVGHFINCSHLLWGFWGLVQASQSVIDFDFVSYALQRLEAYSFVQ